ncbi:MAG: cytochrome-c peroxidase [bacterium]|nr:cytochrome-c peroxidase [bacterium]
MKLSNRWNQAIFTACILGLISIAGCNKAAETQQETTSPKDPLIEKALGQFQPLPDQAPALAGNPMSEARLDLGKKLFLDPRISSSQLISCNTCHNLGTGGVDLQKTSTGHAWQQGPRNAPTVLNSGLFSHQFWDGRAADLEAQAKGPVQAGVEMSNTPAVVEATLKSMPAYVEAFKAAFPGEEQPVSFDNFAKAVALFESTLLTPSAFDRFLKGDAQALDAEAKEGLNLFMDKGCSSCHGGVALGGQGFQKFGLINAPEAKHRPAGDKGRMKVTGDAADEYAFRVPTLRNIADTRPYFHTGSAQTLAEAIRVMGKSQLGVDLTDEEVSKIQAFLNSLSGQVEVTYPNLPSSSDQTPQPNLSVAKGH